jgi:murein DD-endopeptidase MepM/ murein hydrolase activator NlpD
MMISKQRYNRYQYGYSATILLVITMIAFIAGGLGYWLGKYRIPQTSLTSDHHYLEHRSQELERERRTIRAHITAIATRVGEMQADLLRINALGQRLVDMAELNSDEFDFSNSAGAGGPDHVSAVNQRQIVDITQELVHMLKQLEDRKRKLNLLETAILERKLKTQFTLDGWPIPRRGVITSEFGSRIHPLSGKRHVHTGVDIAAPQGTPIVAIADGLVTFAGKQNGYGNIIELTHVNGFKTRYAHNQKNLVTEGDFVQKGQRIALLGSTGQSTGPHVHFEVLDHNRHVNPMRYLNPHSYKQLAQLKLNND